jgi:hypothetical membrane protein
MWLLRPVYVVLELVVAGRTTGDYALAHDTVSELGATVCTPAFCSPWRDLMNGAFVVAGLLLALGALLLAARLGRPVTVLLLVAGASSMATGLAPIDDGATLHAAAAAPLFVCQPLALVLLARRLRPAHAQLARWLLLTGALTAAATLGFVGGMAGAGALERLALWPPIVAFAAVAAVVAGSRRQERTVAQL